MPCWYYDKVELRHTPSIRDGLALETERRYRREGARFIMSCGTNMGLGHNTLATGIVYFHRFYMFHSFKNFPRYVTACCCLLLAGKVEETPKKCWDIINIARQLLTDNHFYSFGKEPKEEVVTLERILLQTIKFDLQVEHPYTYLLKYAKCLKGDQQKLQKMVQMAWNFVNDSLSTVLCLQWEPEIIAVALIYLASKLSKFTVSDWKGRQTSHTRWWDMFVQDMTMDILEDICHQVLDLYQNNPKDTSESNSPPQKPPSRIESPSMTRASGVGNSQPIPTIGSYKNNNPGGFGGNVMNSSANNSKPSTSAHAATVFSGDNGGSSNNGAGSSGNNGGSSRKGGCAPLLPPAPSSYTGGSKDASNTTGGGGGGGGHYSQQHRSGVSSHSTHLYGTTTQNATANSTGSSHSALTHLQSLYSQVTLPPPPPPPPSSKYPSHPPSHSSTGRNTSPPVPSGSMVSKLQPPLPSQPAPSFNAPTYTYNHPHYANAMPPIPMAPLPRLPPPPPPPPVKSSMPSANTAIGPSIPSSSHHKQIPLPSSSYPSTSGGSGGSSSGSSRQRH